MDKNQNLIKFTTYILLIIASFFVLSNSASAVNSCSLPDESGIVQAVASQFPEYLNNSCQESGGTWQFMDEVVERLQAKDSRWGYNGKRGDRNDPSEDAISYYFGSSRSPANGDTNVYIIDIIGGHCGANPGAGWLDQTQATAAAGTTGAYIYNRTSGASAPSSNTTCSVSQPPAPAPVPTGPPTITGISPQTAVAGETVEIFGTNLNGATVQLKSTLGVTYDISGATAVSNTELRFEVPSEIPNGSYSVVVTNSSGTTESSQNLTLRTREKPFNTILRLDTPNEGLPNFGQLIAIIFTWSLNILGIVVFVMVFFAGFKWFTAAGNTAKVNEARSQITNAIIGAIILLSAYIILNTINPDLVGGRFVLPGIGTSTTPSGPTSGSGDCPDCRCADSGQGTEDYRRQVKDANDSALVVTGLTNAPNTAAKRQIFLNAVVAELIEAGLNATVSVLNGHDIPGSAIDLIGVWSTSDRTMERYDILSGTALTIGDAAQVDYTGDIPLSCTY